MDYVKIPQNVRVKDKLIGPLSLFQIIAIAAGGGISYTLFAIVQKSLGYVPTVAHLFIWIPLIVISAFAVIRINDIPLTRYSLLMIELMSKPRKRVWQPRKGILAVASGAHILTSQKKKKKGEEKEAPVQKKSEVRLDELSVILDREGEKSPALQSVERSSTVPL
jgi:hypothetical protein